jgi:hypothetical protein
MTEQEYDRARALFTYAVKQGLDWAKVLDTYDFLATTRRARELQVKALMDLKMRMDRFQAHEHLRRLHTDGPYTAAQMHQALESFIDEYISLLEKGEIEP